MNEQFQRTCQMLGEHAVSILQSKHVAVFGLGGVGGMCAEVLCRMGIGALTLIDGDRISSSNCNRQIVASCATIGKRKTDVMAARCADIQPHIKLQAIPLFYLADQASAIDFGAFDYVVDAVDTVSAKIDIIVQCVHANIPIISCMGMGFKTDIRQLAVADIEKTSVCPLAKIMRVQLKKRQITQGVSVVFSTEVPKVSEHGIKQKRGEIASLPYVPMTAGILMAQKVCDDLIQQVVT